MAAHPTIPPSAGSASVSAVGKDASEVYDHHTNCTTAPPGVSWCIRSRPSARFIPAQTAVPMSTKNTGVATVWACSPDDANPVVAIPRPTLITVPNTIAASSGRGFAGTDDAPTAMMTTINRLCPTVTTATGVTTPARIV